MSDLQIAIIARQDIEIDGMRSSLWEIARLIDSFDWQREKEGGTDISDAIDLLHEIRQVARKAAMRKATQQEIERAHTRPV